MIPKSARELIDACLDNGWSVLVQHGKDTGDSPSVSIEAAESKDGRKVRATWHTRGSGTYRMFSCMIGKRDATLKAAITYVMEGFRVSHDLPAGMVTLGGALHGFLTELEERCVQQEGGNSALVQDRRRLSRAPEGI